MNVACSVGFHAWGDIAGGDPLPLKAGILVGMVTMGTQTCARCDATREAYRIDSILRPQAGATCRMDAKVKRQLLAECRPKKDPAAWTEETHGHELARKEANLSVVSDERLEEWREHFERILQTPSEHDAQRRATLRIVRNVQAQRRAAANGDAVPRNLHLA